MHEEKDADMCFMINFYVVCLSLYRDVQEQITYLKCLSQLLKTLTTVPHGMGMFVKRMAVQDRVFTSSSVFNEQGQID